MFLAMYTIQASEVLKFSTLPAKIHIETAELRLFEVNKTSMRQQRTA
jgi:hypothetical protein